MIARVRNGDDGYSGVIINMYVWHWDEHQSLFSFLIRVRKEEATMFYQTSRTASRVSIRYPLPAIVSARVHLIQVINHGGTFVHLAPRVGVGQEWHLEPACPPDQFVACGGAASRCVRDCVRKT